MQGYVVRIQRVRNEDLIVTILTEHRLQTVYRFYGARHSTLNLGYKIDFEIEHTLQSPMGRLRDVIHLGFPWLKELGRTRLWHQFVSLFYPHLKDAEETGAFYFELFEHCASLWGRQNPKRLALEAYVSLLEYEGRLPDPSRCFFCELPIEEKHLTVIRSFHCAHEHCTHAGGIERNAFTELTLRKSALFLCDDDVERLWLVLKEGL